MLKKQSPSIQVMLVDDHSLVRRGLRLMLKKQTKLEIVAEASSGEEAIQLARSLSRLDIVLMDIRMPGMGGIEATRKLKRIHKGVKILIITACNSDLFVSHLLQAGADGYITKDANAEDMIKAMQRVLTGQTYIDSALANRLAVKNVTGQGKTPFDTLSDRELQVCLMVTNGVSAQSIAETLLLSPKTVNSYRYRIFEKLNVDNDVGLTRLAIRYGLVEFEILKS